MTSIDEILFDENLPLWYGIGRQIKNKYGDIKCFIARDMTFQGEGLKPIAIFTKFGYGIGRTQMETEGYYDEIKFSYSFLFGIKCIRYTGNYFFNIDLYNKYYNLIKDKDITALKEEKNEIIRINESEYNNLLDDYNELIEKFKNEKNKNEVLEDLIEKQSIRLHNNIDNLKVKLNKENEKNISLLQEKNKLLDEIDIFKEDMEFLEEEHNLLLQEKNKLLQEKELLIKETNLLRNNNYEEIDTLIKETNLLRDENNLLSQKKYKNFYFIISVLIVLIGIIIKSCTN